MQWKREWFAKLPVFPHSHWNSLDNRRKFLEEIATTSNIRTPNDWRKISTSVITNKGGRV